MYMIHTRYRIHIYEFVIDDIKKTFSGRLNDFLLINIFIRFSVKIPIKYFLSHDIQWFDRKSKSQKKKKKIIQMATREIELSVLMLKMKIRIL